MQLEFGLSDAVPESVTTAWGARLIYPADLLWDRQDLQETDEKPALIEWLNRAKGKPAGSGAIHQAQVIARKAADQYKIHSDGREKVILYQDDLGVIVACPNSSYGYLYVAGWLHNGDRGKLPVGFEALVFLTQKQKDTQRKAARLAWEQTPVGQMTLKNPRLAKLYKAANR